MPDRFPFARDNAPNLLTLLNEVRDAKPDERDFAWFDRRDALMKTGVPRAQVDGFNARDNAALERQIAHVRSTASGGGRRPSFADAGGDALRSPPVTNPIQPGPTGLETANRIAREEKARALQQARLVGVDPLNNRFDAERHARWTYRMAKELGPTLATMIGIGHEITGLPALKFDETLMDLHNNGVGIGQARAGGAMPNAKTPGLKMQPRDR